MNNTIELASNNKVLVEEGKTKKPSKISLPKYCFGEDLANSISHGLGAVFGVVALIMCLVKCIASSNVIGAVSTSVFCVSLIMTYSISCIYHSLNANRAKKVFRVLDHCSIFLLIAGTYTPYMLVTLGSLTLGKVIFGIVWGMGILGIVLNAVDLKKYAVISCLCYVAIGWVIVIAFKPMLANMAIQGIVLLVTGGISYTIGAVLYALRRKYCHFIFHVLCLIGSVLMFLSIYMFVI